MVKLAKLGGTASNITVRKTAHGLMLMTWKPVPVPDEQCFEAILAGLDQLPSGAKMLINSGEFYGRDQTPANLELLARFFDKYPDTVDKFFLSVKGGGQYHSFIPDASPENLRRSLDYINEKLGGKKKVDLFQCSRVDSKYPIEDTMKELQKLVKEGKFDHIGLSEVNADTVKRANAVVPVAAVEIEVSPWSYEEETKKVIATCAELNIPVVAYAPIGRGFLTGQIKKQDDLEENDMRRFLSRFQEDNIKHNYKIVDALTVIASKKGITPAQLSIAWVSSLGPQVLPLPGSSHKSRKLENLAGGDVDLTAEELKEIERVLTSHEVKGGRYNDSIPPAALGLWG